MKLCPTCAVPCEPWFYGGKRKMMARTARPKKDTPRFPASICPECGAVVLETEPKDDLDREGWGQ